MIEILSAVRLKEEHRAQLASVGAVNIVDFDRGSEVTPDAAETAEVWFGPGPSPELLERASKLRWVQLISAGVERHLHPELVASEIIVTNARGLHAKTIADHVFGCILAFSRNLVTFIEKRHLREWTKAELSALDGSVLAVIGLGEIGREVAVRGKAFGMRVIGSVRHPRDIPGVDLVEGPDQLDRLLQEADWLVLAAPHTRETHHLIGAKELNEMKPQCVLINIGRGQLIDEPALVDALESGKLRGAALDVFEKEPLPPESPLWTLPNVIVTPHVSGLVDRYLDRAIDIFSDNLRRYVDGAPLNNLVDKNLGY